MLVIVGLISQTCLDRSLRAVYSLKACGLS